MSSPSIPAPASAPQASTFRFDLVAGLTAAAVVLPKAMAYASVAGLPVAVGLYTAFIPMAIYALLGTSRVLSVSSTTTIAILAATQLGLAVPDGDPARLVTATATLTLVVGAALVAARLLRLGFVANFISTPVLTGFKAGIGLVIVLDQVPKLLGIHIAKHGFFFDAASVVNHMPETSTITLMVALATFAVLIAMERLWPHSPAPLVAVAGGIAAAWFLGLEKMGVSIVGLIPQGFPSLTLPDPALVQRLLPGALGSIDEFPAVGERVSDRDFDADMLACVHRGERWRYMPLPRRGDIDVINVVAFDQLLETALAFKIKGRSTLSRLLNHGLSLQDLVLHDVAQGRDPHARYI